MKTPTLILCLIFSISINAQSDKSYGFITERYDYNFVDSTWDIREISGVDISFQMNIFDSAGVNYLSIETMSMGVGTANSYMILDKTTGGEEGYKYNLFALCNPFSDKMLLRYDKLLFTLYFDHNPLVEIDAEYTSYFRGTFYKL